MPKVNDDLNSHTQDEALNNDKEATAVEDVKTLKKKSVHRMEALNIRQKPAGIPDMETKRTYEVGLPMGDTGRTSSSNREEQVSFTNANDNNPKSKGTSPGRA